MKKIDATNITGTTKAPYVQRTFLHYNEAIQETLNYLFRSQIPDAWATGNIVILYGCEVSGGVGPGTAAVSAGAVYYNGEIYEVLANPSITTTGSQTLIWQLSVTYAVDDPVQYTNGSFYDQHQINRLELVAGTSGNGLMDYNASTVRNYSKTYSTGAGGVYEARNGNTVFVSINNNVGNLNDGDTIYTISAENRTSASRTLGVSASCFTNGGGSAQSNLSIPCLVNTNTGVIEARMDMPTTTDVIVLSFSYLLD